MSKFFLFQPLFHLFHRFEKGVVVEAVAGVSVRKEGDELHVLDFFEKGGDIDLVEVESVDDGFLCDTLDGNFVAFFVGDDAAFVEKGRARFELRLDQEHALPVVLEERREIGDEVAEGNKRDVGNDEVVPASSATSFDGLSTTLPSTVTVFWTMASWARSRDVKNLRVTRSLSKRIIFYEARNYSIESFLHP